jgi:hypothetical protein
MAALFKTEAYTPAAFLYFILKSKRRQYRLKDGTTRYKVRLTDEDHLLLVDCGFCIGGKHEELLAKLLSLVELGPTQSEEFWVVEEECEKSLDITFMGLNLIFSHTRKALNRRCWTSMRKSVGFLYCCYLVATVPEVEPDGSDERATAMYLDVKDELNCITVSEVQNCRDVLRQFPEFAKTLRDKVNILEMRSVLLTSSTYNDNHMGHTTKLRRIQGIPLTTRLTRIEALHRLSKNRSPAVNYKGMAGSSGQIKGKFTPAASCLGCVVGFYGWVVSDCGWLVHCC